MFLERYAINPVNGERLPIWAADYVLADYGHGAVMAVPAHDQRDLDFARAFDLPVKVVVDTTAPITGAIPVIELDEQGVPIDPGADDSSLDDLDPAKTGIALTGEGRMINSGSLDGLSKRNAIARIIEQLEAARHRPRRQVVSPARLAHLAPALLGHADPDDPHRGRPHRAGAGRPASAHAARRRRAST